MSAEDGAKSRGRKICATSKRFDSETQAMPGGAEDGTEFA